MSQKIVFMGTPEFSVPTLKLLLKSEHKILVVYSQPATKAHRGQKISSSSVENFSKKKALNVRTPLTLDSDEEYEITWTAMTYELILQPVVEVET